MSEQQLIDHLVGLLETRREAAWSALRSAGLPPSYEITVPIVQNVEETQMGWSQGTRRISSTSTLPNAYSPYRCQ